MSSYDVIIVGAGFAGITAARECATRGLRTLVLEARHRIGGRSGSVTLSDGTAADIGGTYVHWTQPHTWSEITRYGLAKHLVPGWADHEWTVSRRDGELQWVDARPAAAAVRSAFQRVMPIAAEVFPNLADPLANEAAVAAVDGLTLTEGLAQADLSEEERAILLGELGGYCSRPPAEASWSNTLRWFAMGQSDYDQFQDLLNGMKLSCGTGALAAAMLADGGAEVRLNTPVSSIRSEAGRVTVTTASEALKAATVIIATPANVWPLLELSPALPESQRTASEAGMQATWAGKGGAVITGEGRSFWFRGDAEAPLTFFTQELRGAEEQVVTIFPGAPSVDLRDPELIKRLIETAMPHVQVLDAAGDMYLADDPAQRGGWGFLAPGQLTSFRPHETFTALDERVRFASSEIAQLHHGFIDGAIESGLRAAREVQAVVAADQKEAVS